MLDTNAFDDIYRMNLADTLKFAVNTGKIKFFMTHVQLDEIAKIKDDTKRLYILNAIEVIPVEKIATAGAVVGTDEPANRGFVGSRYDEARIVSDEEDELLNELTRNNSNNPMKNTADLMIAFTAVKEK